MAQIKWKIFTVLLVFQGIHAHLIQESISMTSDGWRPIVGAARKPQPPSTQEEEIRIYRNPLQDSETVRAETLSTARTQPPTSPPTAQATPLVPPTQQPPPQHAPAKPPFPKDHKPGHGKPAHHTNSVKIIPHLHKNQYFVMSNGAHGPHIPISQHARPPMFKKYPPIGKYNSHGGGNGKRMVKPIRLQAAHSQREEIFLQPPTGLSQFAPGKQSAIKIRQNSDLAVHGAKPFRGSQSIDFTNHFQLGSPGPGVFQTFNSPVQSYVHLKLPQTNEVHYQLQNQDDEYTRNLVPPPTFQTFQDVRKPLGGNQNHNRLKGIVVNTPDQTANKKPQQFVNQKPLVETVLPSPFPSQAAYPVPPKIDHQNVQITKEQLKVFHNEVPLSFNPQRPQGFDFDFHAVKTPSSIQKAQTYEVTESQFQQETQQFPRPNQHFQHFSNQQFQQPAQQFQQPNQQFEQANQQFEQANQQFEQANQQFPGRFPQEVPQVFIGAQRPILKARPPPKKIAKQPPKLDFSFGPFLPTPYRPETVAPTSPTQNEVSTIFTQLSQQISQQNPHQQQQRYPVESVSTFFDVKEVSTHYPIVGKPLFEYETTTEHPDRDISNEITINYLKNAHARPITTPESQPKTTLRTRLPPKRKRPTFTTTTTTTTEEPPTTELIEEPQRTQESYQTELSVETETSPPVRRRKPHKHRTTTTPAPYVMETEEEAEEISTERPTRVRYRYRTRMPRPDERYRKRVKGNGRRKATKAPPQTMVEEPAIYETDDVRNSMGSDSTERYAQSQNEDSAYVENADVTEISRESYTMRPALQHYEHPDRFRTEKLEIRDSYDARPNKDFPAASVQTSGFESMPELTEYPRYAISTGKPQEDEPQKLETFDLTTMRNPWIYNRNENTEPIRETADDAYTTQLASTTPTTTTTTTTTTTETPTTRTQRLRQRPMRYNVSNRPRFSVKEYRQRLNQYTANNASSDAQNTAADSSRVRFPTRSRRPTSSSTPAASQGEESSTEKSRGRFRPKEPRHGAAVAESNNLIITEKNVKPVNTNLRPFGRLRATTESNAPGTRVSIRPNLFARRTRPPHLSLRTRIQSKSNATESNDEKENVTDQPADETSPLTAAEEEAEAANTEEGETTTADILKNESYLYSQRVSDLTSSAKKEYNTPGLFKAVAPTSRRIPNYFTISTDDPILPIEAFFPNIKEKE